MESILNNYCKNITKKFNSGISTEHSYRGDLQDLIRGLCPGISITNEPKRQRCGAPDFIIHKKEVPVGYIEAKDIDANLDTIEKSEQLKRYLKSLDNLILTDYLEFRFFKHGEKVKEINIASIENSKIKKLPDNFAALEKYIVDACTFQGITIKSADKLAKMMAQMASLMEEVLLNVVKEDEEYNSLKDQLHAFREILIHDLNEETFADIYAQTIAYGLFAARLHDPVLETFSREEARGLIPRTNPFLRNLFDYVAGAQLDDRVVWIVNDLADIFRATDLKNLLADFGRSTGQSDPFIHFYETFLGEYKPALRKKRGVYYTPEPVVNFIVRAVDDILKEDFNIKDGLADNSKIKLKVNSDIVDKRTATGYKQREEQVHRVQILDPAAGTGTFLAEVIKQIYKKFEGQQGIWANYVEEHLIPRINGFEILMAPYTMCHMKLEMLLNETGYKPSDDRKQKRLRVFLTNSLEEAHPDTGTLFASWLSTEAQEANEVKKETPVMVVLGNPPYSVSSSNKSEWIENLIADYKRDLNERKINIDDDYIKFIRFGQHFVDKNGEGVLAYISNNSFLDGITHRQMRKHLLESFDKIYILNLHGNARKKETCPDGSPDQNVFDIMQGVSINLFIKTGKKQKTDLGEVFYDGLYGKRESKYSNLIKNSVNCISWENLKHAEPYRFFVPKDFKEEEEYGKGMKITEIFGKYSAGIKTKIDHIATDFSKKDLELRVENIISNRLDFNAIRQKYGLSEKTTWEYKPNSKLIFDIKKITRYEYRPFDIRYIYYDHEFLSRSRREVMNNFFQSSNIGLENSRNGDCTFIGKFVSDEHFISGNSFRFPLYTFPTIDSTQIEMAETTKRHPNLNQEIVQKIADSLELIFTTEKEDTPGTFAPIDILDYIYAVLHSPSYREKYKEFLKIDFPRVPYPNDKDVFWKLVKLGSELRTIHLLESPVVEEYITSYPVAGNNIVDKVKYEDKKVFINKEQYFNNVPEVAWNFYIGGYQPAQKWLKDRKGRGLKYEDILHYQKIIVALTETERIMGEIDEVMGRE